MKQTSILICEDERLIAKDIEIALKRSGYEIAGIAADGERALCIAEQSSPDLALMDIRLEGALNGIEVAGLLNDEFQIPSIYLTAHADEETLKEAKETFPLSYLLKPFDERELKTAVEMGLHRHRKQCRRLNALQNLVTTIGDVDLIENAVNLEREFMSTERTNACLRVAGNIAGKLKDDLTAIGKFVEAVSHEVSLEHEKNSMLRSALRHQTKALETVNKLHRFSGRSELQLEETLIEVVVNEAAHEARCQRGTDIAVIASYSSDALLTMIDQEKVREILVHLFLNAYRAMSGRSIVTLGTSLTYEGFPERYNSRAKPGWYLGIQVGDDGTGIERENLERIFEPCYSSPASTSGDGLGLCLVQAVMQDHLGWVRIHSSPTTGTRVSLYFPCIDPPTGIKDRRGEAEFFSPAQALL